MRHEFRMYVGPMFGGKTTRMLSQLERYHYQDEDFAVLKRILFQILKKMRLKKLTYLSRADFGAGFFRNPEFRIPIPGIRDR